MLSDREPKHWLISVLERAGLPNAASAELDPDVAGTVAWDAMCGTCGVSPEELARHVAAAFHLAVAELKDAEPSASRLLPSSVARKYGVIPLRDNYKQLVVATSDPSNLDAERDIGFASGRAPLFEIAAPRAIEQAIDAAYAPDRAVERLLVHLAGDSANDVRVVEDAQAEEHSADEVEAGPVVKLMSLILRDAVKQRASDIHVQSGVAGGVVRFRVDGILRQYMQVPRPVFTRLVARIKVMGKLDIADRLRPQDGRARIDVDGVKYDLRISTVPTRGLEKAVLRILDPSAVGGLDSLGLPATELEQFKRLLTHREGIIIITGPTGSGKTTTLYGALLDLSTDEVNIMTVEDPVEYQVPGLTQIQVETKQGVTFASALRAALRQDPDIILIGEIRDQETAEVAVRAAMTGHLVLATLHANSAVGAVQRLTDIGLDRVSIAASLRGVLAQRLARRICADCVEAIDGRLTEEEDQLQVEFSVESIVRARGCPECGQSGYRGRIPLVEVFTIRGGTSTLIQHDTPEEELVNTAKANGMRSLLDGALDRVRAGDTTLAEVARVIGLGDDDQGSAVAPATEAPADDSLPVPSEPITIGRQSCDVSMLSPQAAPGATDDEPIAVQNGVRVLVVDDDGATRGIARALLQREGCAVSEAADGEAALGRFARGEEYDLMVLDLDMPKLGGRDVIKAVRSSLKTAGLPIIVLTGSTDPNAESELLNEGADDYVRKPIDPARFLAHIKATLRRANL